MKILHLTPHLGGGVGRFLTNLAHADSRHEHQFCLLESPIDTDLLEGISWCAFDAVREGFDRYLAQFDVVQVEFWNHPLLFKFLAANPLPECRLVAYAHVSGIYAPNIIPEAIFALADQVVLSTPAAAGRYAERIRNGACTVIHEIGGVTRTAGVRRVEHAVPSIAYIGTASHAKLHPGFVRACAALLKHRPEVRFTVATNDDNAHLRAEAEELGIGGSFDFILRANDIEGILAGSDLFGYPMRPDHFGTGEQALLETMGAGVAPVVIGNAAERSLVEDGVTGVIAEDIYDYVRALRYCLDHPEFARAVGARARAFALENFSVQKTAALFHELYREAAARPKRPRNFVDCVSIDAENPGWSLYKLCLGDHPDIAGYEKADDQTLKGYFREKILSSPHLANENKGGMRMYLRHFPEDRELRRFLGEDGGSAP